MIVINSLIVEVDQMVEFLSFTETFSWVKDNSAISYQFDRLASCLFMSKVC